MKKAIIMVVLTVLMAAPAFASNTSAEAIASLCKSIGEAGKVTMMSRQAGVPIHKVMAAATNRETREFVIQVYKVPIYSGKNRKNSAIQNFENEAAIACYQSFIK